jgi:[protein-PII] uridylyltransferase
MNAFPMPDQPTPKDWVALRDAARRGEVPTLGLAQALSTTMDRVIEGLAADLPQGALVLAHGGYSTGFLAPWSDIDLLVVSAKRLSSDDVRPLLMPLWDAGLKVGHGVRTVKEATMAMDEDPITATTMLNARRITGPLDIEEKLDKRVEKWVGKHRQNLAQRIIDDEVARREAEPHMLLAGDIKQARGGLRSLDTIRWLDALEGNEPDERALGLRRRLFDLRSALQLVTGRATDVPELSMCTPAGKLLGVATYDYRAALISVRSEVELLLDRRFDQVRATRPEPRSVAPQPDSPVLRAAIDIAHGDEAESDPDLRPVWSEADRRALLWLMTDPAGRFGFEYLQRTGWIAGFLAEWEWITGVPHVVPFHLHPVDVHSLRTHDELLKLEAWKDLGRFDREVLRWGSLFHDIGKGHGGNHAAKGGPIIERLGTRLRWPPALTREVRRLVIDHLALADITLGNDMRDRSVIARACEQFGDRAHVRRLRLLTEADSRATGDASTWTPWRASLIDAGAEAISNGFGASGTAPAPLSATLADFSGVDRTRVIAHLSELAEGYRDRVPTDAIAAHLRLLAHDDEASIRAELVEVKGGVATVAVVAQDRVGLLAELAGRASVAGLDVVAANLFTRRDGIAVDIFDFAVARGDLAATVHEWIESLGTPAPPGELRDAVAAQAHAYRHEASDTEVSVRARAIGTKREVRLRAPDRRGLLYLVASALGELDLSIDTVRIDTRAGIAHQVVVCEGEVPWLVIEDAVRTAVA